MSLGEFLGKKALEATSKLAALDLAQKAIDGIDSLLQGSEDTSETEAAENQPSDSDVQYQKVREAAQNIAQKIHEAATDEEAAAKRASYRDAAFQKIRETAQGVVKQAQDAIEKREQEKQAAYEEELERLRFTYPFQLTLYYEEQPMIENAVIIETDGVSSYTIKTQCPLGRRILDVVDKNGNSVLHIEENKPIFSLGPFGVSKRSTYFTIKADEMREVKVDSKHVKEYGWNVSGRWHKLSITNARGETIAESKPSNRDNKELNMYFKYQETKMTSLGIFMLDLITSYNCFSNAYTKYYRWMDERYYTDG